MWGRSKCGDGRLRPSGGPVFIGPPGFELALIYLKSEVRTEY